MPQGLTTLLARSIDYAGLFPPAALGMGDAVSNYARDRLSADSWMLSRLIMPAARLPEFCDSAASHLDAGDPWPLSVLARGGKNSTEFLEKLALDLADIETTHARIPSGVTTDLIEARLPADSVNSGRATELFLAIEDILESADMGETRLFLEAPPIGALTGLLHALAVHNRSTESRSKNPWGYKLRTGGMEASAFPSTAEVAFAIGSARTAGVAMKCTAGLHHPLRHFNDSVNAKMHGFLNVFGCAALAQTDGPERPELEEILRDEDPASFSFDDKGLWWKGRAIQNGSISESRRSLLVSFGSCSFDEPREDLKALGLWAGTNNQ